MDDHSTIGFAIVGMAGRFPGADNVEALWDQILSGRTSIHRFRSDEIEDDFSTEERSLPNYVAARPVLLGIDQFDAEFFGVPNREAALIDPQQRLLLEVAWQTLEDGGCDPSRYLGSIGVFAGSSYNTYFIRHVCSTNESLRRFTSEFQVGSYQELLGTLNDFVATRIAYKLNLRGPAVNVQSACSTSLLAVAQACQSLAFYQCDAALAGGVSITLPQRRGYFYLEGGISSADGTVRPFDADARGTVFGSGAGMVLLKRYSDALADGDHIYGVIKGYGVNNDGARKVGFTAPSVDGQAECIASSMAMAEFAPGTIGYVECHGTATPLGDPIEVKGLVKAFGELVADDTGSADRTVDCAIGSIKANVGHLDAAAGVVGLIKAAKILQTRTIPPQVMFERPNPRLELDSCGLRIVREREPLREQGAPRRVGVSAFGVGGTNVHLSLEEVVQTQATSEVERGAVVLTLSARSGASLDEMRGRLISHLQSSVDNTLPDIAKTLREGRQQFSHRVAVGASNASEAIAKLASISIPARPIVKKSKVVFLFPGQGSQYPGMGAFLYKSDDRFRRDIDFGAEALMPLLASPEFDGDIRHSLLDTAQLDEDTSHPIRSTLLAQPALFLLEWSLVRLLERLGLAADAMIGHSLGEFTAACQSGVLRFEDAIHLIARRSRLMQNQPSGAMLSVRMRASDLANILPDGVSIAANNSARLSVASGPHEKIAELVKELDARGVVHRKLHTSHAFHSSMMDGVVSDLEKEAAALQLAEPVRPIMSCVTGDWLSPAEATSPRYWAHHCRATVQFGPAISRILDDSTFDQTVFVEVGPGRTLSTIVNASASLSSKSWQCVSTLPEYSERDSSESVFANALGDLWASGVPVNVAGVGPRGTKKVSLPGYAFQRRRHWIEPKVIDTTSSSKSQKSNSDESESRTVNPMRDQLNGQAPSPHSLQPVEEVQDRIVHLLQELLGQPISAEAFNSPFISLGCDSLLLGQFTQKLNGLFSTTLTFRQLMRDLNSIRSLSNHILSVAPAERLSTLLPRQIASDSLKAPVQSAKSDLDIPAVKDPKAHTALTDRPAAIHPLEDVIRDQISTMQSLFAMQIAALTGSVADGAAASMVNRQSSTSFAEGDPGSAPVGSERGGSSTASHAVPNRFQVLRRREEAGDDLTPSQREFINQLIRRYNAKTPLSKVRTQDCRAQLADPRSVSNFQPAWKELVYPVVCKTSKGARIHDIDGNVYIDLVNGYGQTMFGHAPEFVVEAVESQLHAGFAIGPQSPLAGEVASQICAMTGTERVAFCNTGSEAVMAAIRIARAVTGRTRIVVFAGGYHGQFDEVLVKGRVNAVQGAAPAALGIPSDNLSQVTVLKYGTAEALDYIRSNANELAAVVAEPVQSRRPEFLPAEFLRELRAITELSGIALVFDEVVTGFRVSPGGMQSVLNIRADLVTYGKVLGGGMPIGVVAGRAIFMDALDGGFWSYGDSSVPEVAPTFFAGTFVRHPLVLAAAKSVLNHIERSGSSLYEDQNRRTEQLAAAINDCFSRRGVSMKAERFSSWFCINHSEEGWLSSLLMPYLRLLGINILEGYPCFVTTSHQEQEIKTIATAFDEATDAMCRAGLFKTGLPASGLSTDTQIPGTSGQNDYPLTDPQREILLAAQFGSAASAAFNESISIELNGPINTTLLIESLNVLVNRHDALRSNVDFAKEKMRVSKELNLEIPILSGEERQLAAFIAADAKNAFNLEAGPLIRAAIFRVSESRHVLVVTAHHIVCDGWSVNVLVNELAELYRRASAGERWEISPAPSFSAYASGQKALSKSTSEKYWRNMFAQLPDPLDLPTDRPRPRLKSYAGASYRQTIDAELTAAANQFARTSGVTLFTVLFSAVQLLFTRLATSGEAILTVPMAGQATADNQDLVGHCVNFLPLRVPVIAHESFAAHLGRVNGLLSAAFDNQNYTLGSLVQALNLPMDSSRAQISEIQFNVERIGATADFGIPSKIRTNAKAFVIFDVFVNLILQEKDIAVEVDYSTDLFDQSTVSRWIDSLRTLLAEAIRAPDTPVDELPLLTARERSALVLEYNQHDVPLSDEVFVHELFEAAAISEPNAVAVVCDSVEMTYGELDVQSAQLANYIRREVPEPGQRIALCLRRSPSMVIALLAVLRAGHTYVPLDMSNPSPRLKQVLDDAAPAAIIADDHAILSTLPNSCIGINVKDKARAIARQSRKLTKRGSDRNGSSAYVIFTSGSTGRPKGVEVTHRALSNLLLAMKRRPGFAEGNAIVAVTSFGFDISGLELLLPIVSGGRTIIATEDELINPARLIKLISSDATTVLQGTPSFLRMLLDADFVFPPGLRIWCGGEVLHRDLAERLLDQNVELWNMYGPTETTIWSACDRVTRLDDNITIGMPIDNTTLHVVGRNMEILPIGCVGELIIGGTGLAAGYFMQPDLTCSAFVNLDLDGRGDKRFYRTGDYACRLNDGRIKLMGRRDEQVKLRGFRIELAEIEGCIGRFHGVHECAAFVDQIGTPDAVLRACVVWRHSEDGSERQLEEFLRSNLPHYMVPSSIVSVPQLPRTPNGKLDKNALRQQYASMVKVVESTVTVDSALPDDKLLSDVRRIVEEVLQREGLGDNDRLFSLGANSLHIFRIAARLVEAGYALDAASLLVNPSLAELAAIMRDASGGGQPPSRPKLSDFARAARRR